MSLSFDPSLIFALPGNPYYRNCCVVNFSEKSEIGCQTSRGRMAE